MPFKESRIINNYCTILFNNCVIKAKVHKEVRSNGCWRLRLCQKMSELLSEPKTSVNWFLNIWMSFISSICHLCVTSIPASLVQLKQPKMDPSLCLQSKLNESPPFHSSTLAALLKHDWLPVGRFYKGLDFAYFTTVDAIL